MTENQVKTNLCIYDRRNPDFAITGEYSYDKEDVDATGNFAKPSCSCDNCFYERTKLAEEILKLKNELELEKFRSLDI